MRRIHKHRARCHLVNGFEDAAVDTKIVDEWEDLILVETISGERAALYLIDNHLNLDDILTTFADNQRQHIHTLYIIASVMFLPDHGDHHMLEDWMSFLANVYGGKIYGYMVKDHTVDICPIYFKSEDGIEKNTFSEGMTVSVRYGAHIDPARFQCWQNNQVDELLVADYAAPIITYTQSLPFETSFSSSYEPQIFSDDPYLVLGVDRNADHKTIRAAYIQLARQYHPDANTETDATRCMQAINAAYEILVADK